MLTQVGELFYVDSDGSRQDRGMRAVILGAVDKFAPPVNEEIMKPIRERNRARWLAKKQRQSLGVW